MSTALPDWHSAIECIEALRGLPLDTLLMRRLALSYPVTVKGRSGHSIHFYMPTFKSFETSEVCTCTRNIWPSISITGGNCHLQCDHCKARVLRSMIAARTPEALWRKVNELIDGGAVGLLLSGGSNRHNEVEYEPFYPVIRRLKDHFPGFTIAVHTGLLDRSGARRLQDAGCDVAMLDIIGAQETISQVYHLRRPVSDFERALEALTATQMRVVPHIVIGLHYGHLRGEWNALEIVRRQSPDALVLVVVTPSYTSAKRPFVTPLASGVGRFFLSARRRLPQMPILLGCARPPGLNRLQTDTYAVLAGIDGIAYPSEGILELAGQLRYKVEVVPACCSVAGRPRTHENS